MDIRSALDRVIEIQGGLSISDPLSLSVKNAYKYSPPASVSLRGNLPAWTNEWTLERIDRHIGLRVQFYTVHMQFFCYDADLDKAADIASAFHVELVTALDADVQLTGDGTVPTVTNSALRGGNPTLAVLDRRDNQPYMGLDLFLDVEMKEGVTFT